MSNNTIKTSLRAQNPVSGVPNNQPQSYGNVTAAPANPQQMEGTDGRKLILKNLLNLRTIVNESSSKKSKPFFQKIFQKIKEWFANSNIWDINKLGAALEVATPEEKLQAYDIIVANLRKLKPQTAEKLEKFVKKSLIKNCSNFHNITNVDAKITNIANKLSHDDLFPISLSIEMASPEEKLQIYDGVATNLPKLTPQTGEKLEKLIKQSILDHCADIQNTTDGGSKIIDIARRLPYNDAFQAALSVKMQHPVLWENMHDVKQMDLLMLNSDLYPTRSVDDSGFPDLDAVITPELFNLQNQEALEKFYPEFKKTLFQKDVIGARHDCLKIKLGDNAWEWRPLQTGESVDDYEKSLTEELLNTIFEFCDKDVEKACKFLSAFVKQQHCSGNCLAPILIGIDTEAGNDLSKFIRCAPTTSSHVFSFSIEVDKNWDMHCSTYALRAHDEQAASRYQAALGIPDPNNAVQYPYSQNSFGTVCIISKINLQKTVHKNVKQDMEVSCLVACGESNQPVPEPKRPQMSELEP